MLQLLRRVRRTPSSAAICLALLASCRAPSPPQRQPLRFPDGFQWGVSASAQESEGNNSNSDWDAFAEIGAAPPAGWAQNSYMFYETDNDNAAALHLNSYQFTIEWARIVPRAPADPTAPLTAADIDPVAVAHYHRVLDSMLAHGLTPVVTITHFSLPSWVDNPAAYDASTNSYTDGSLGGWTNPKTALALARYAEFLSREYGDQVKWWLTMDEPMVELIAGYMFGNFPPGLQELDLETASLPNGASPTTVLKNMIAGHALAYHAMKAVHPELKVSFAQNSVDWEALHPGDADARARGRVDFAYNLQFLDAVTFGRFDNGWVGAGPLEPHPEWANTLDYVGVNYYDRAYVIASSMFPPLNATPCSPAVKDAAPDIFKDLGCPDRGPPQPPGMTKMLLEYQQRYHLPLFITESGFIDTPQGKARRLVQTLAAVHDALDQGANVVGYSYWTLNYDYEWNDGWSQDMGLYTIPGFGDGGFPLPDGGHGGPDELTDFTRVPLHPMVDVYAEIAGANAIPVDLLDTYPTDAGQ